MGSTPRLPLVLCAALACGGGGPIGGPAADTGTSTTGVDTSTSTTTASTSGTSTSGGGPSSGSTGVVFIHEPDGGASDCDLLQQDCPPGEKCSMWSMKGTGNPTGTACMPIEPDPRGPWETCTLLDPATLINDCDLGLACWPMDGATGLCIPHCSGSEASPFCADPEAACVMFSNGLPALCTVPCNPLTQDCPAGLSCHPERGVHTELLCHFAPEGTGMLMDPCNADQGCQTGLVCERPSQVPGCTGENGCCVPFCEVADPQCPPELGAVECVPIPDVKIPSELTDVVGVCALPGG